MPPVSLRLFYENAAGQLLAQPLLRGGYAVIEHRPGPRRLADVQNLLGQTKLLLAKRGWHKLLGDQREMTPFTPEEASWITGLWLNTAQPRHPLFGAVLLPAPVFAQLPPAVAEAPGLAAALTYRLFDDPASARTWLAELA